MRKKLGSQDQKLIDDYFKEKGLPTNIALTYDDVAVADEYSTIESRSDIQDFSMLLVKGLSLNIPIIAANMRAVTGAEMIIAIEREGGLGVVPQDLKLEERLEILEHVGRAECAVIEEPLIMGPNALLKEARKKMQKYGISGLLVVDTEEKLLGILGSRDWRYEADDTKKLSELMTSAKDRPLITAQKNITLQEAAQLLQKHRIEKLPLVDEHKKVVGLITARGLFYGKRYPRALRDDMGRFIRVGSVGVMGRSRDINKILEEVEAQLDKMDIKALMIDTARAFARNTEETIAAIKKIKKEFSLPLIVGNVSNPLAVKFLFDLGVECVKIGQGPGSACTTREVGVGVPQLTAVAQAAALARAYGRSVIADGGIKGPHDIGKALVAGANAVMLGNLLAGTEESAETSYMKYSEEFGAYVPVKDFYGSASFEAQSRRKDEGSLDTIRRPEGMKKAVPVVGSVSRRIGDLLDGLRSFMSYQGVRTVKELQQEGRFILQTTAGYLEGTKGKV